MFITEQDYNKEEVSDIFYDETAIWDEDMGDEVTEEEIAFARELRIFLQGLIEDEESYIKEDFTSYSNASIHFGEHCMVGDASRISTVDNVFYDFDNIDDYLNYEDIVSKKVIAVKNNNTNMFINNLYDVKSLNSAIRRLFKGGTSMVFGLACQFHNNKGPVRICINAFATDATTNYQSNTVDILTQSPNDKTISLYALDANRLESKLNSMMRLHNVDKKYKFTFNH